jgi:hypothetical protein
MEWPPRLHQYRYVYEYDLIISISFFVENNAQLRAHNKCIHEGRETPSNPT